MKSTQVFLISFFLMNQGMRIRVSYGLNDGTQISRHMFFTTAGKQEEVDSNVDQFNDSYTRNTTTDELKDVSTIKTHI